MAIGTTEWIIIGVAVVLFGGAAISKLLKNAGRASGEFKKGQLEMEAELAELEAKKKAKTA